MQYAKFPMRVVNITQVPNNNFSHKGSVSAFDNAGKDSGIDNAFAPFDSEIVWKDNGSAKTGVLIHNTDFVKCADGLIREPKTVKVLLWHDNDIKDLVVGRKLKQDEVFYQEGTAGHATGNHVHFNVGIGRFDGTYPLIKNEFGVWEIKGEVDPTKIFYIDNSNTVINTNGMKWVKYVEESVQVPVQIKVGSKVKIVGDKYSTGQVVPARIKQNSYTVEKLVDSKVLLKEIKSWVYVKDVQLI